MNMVNLDSQLVTQDQSVFEQQSTRNKINDYLNLSNEAKKPYDNMRMSNQELQDTINRVKQMRGGESMIMSNLKPKMSAVT